MDFFECSYYRVNKRFLHFVGQWPYQTAKERFIRTTVMLAIGISGLLVMLAKIVTSFNNLGIFTQFLPYGIITAIICLRYIAYICFNKKLKELFELIKSDWDFFKNKEGINILENTTEEGSFYVLCCTLFVYASSFAFLVLSALPPILDIILSRNETFHEHPFPFEYFVDSQKFFYPILFHMNLIAISGITIALACDTTYIVYAQHACGVFRVAGYQLTHAFDTNEQLLFATEKNHKFWQKIVDGVESHNRALQYVAKMTSFYGWCNFSSLILGVISIGCSMYCTAIFIGEWKEMIKSLLCTSGQMLYLFVTMYPGQMLIDCSTSITPSVYFGNWYVAPVSTQRSLLIIMRKGMIPSTVVLGKFISGSLEFYAMVIRTAVSLFTALYSIQN